MSGDSRFNWAVWMMDNGGAAGRLEVCKFLERLTSKEVAA